MADVAVASNVSLATVDRVLNRRKGVSAKTVDRVLRAATELGYVIAGEFSSLASQRLLNVAFLLPMGGNPYIRILGEKVRALAEDSSREKPRIRCFFIESFDANALAHAIRRHAGWADAIAFMGIDHPLVREAIAEVQAMGKRLVTIVSDVPCAGREAYVGLDNQIAGRTAAYLMGRFCRTPEGSVALVAGSRTYRAHSEREMAFLALMEESHPRLRVVGVREGHDDRGENYRHALSLIDQNADLVGIYNVGGSSDGIARALQERGKSDSVVFIGHGLTADTRRLLIDGTMDVVLDCDPDQLILRALNILYDAQYPKRADVGAGQDLRIEIVLRENIPAANLIGSRQRTLRAL